MSGEDATRLLLELTERELVILKALTTRFKPAARVAREIGLSGVTVKRRTPTLKGLALIETKTRKGLRLTRKGREFVSWLHDNNSQVGVSDTDTNSPNLVSENDTIQSSLVSPKPVKKNPVLKRTARKKNNNKKTLKETVTPEKYIKKPHCDKLESRSGAPPQGKRERGCSQAGRNNRLRILLEMFDKVEACSNLKQVSRVTGISYKNVKKHVGRLRGWDVVKKDKKTNLWLKGENFRRYCEGKTNFDTQKTPRKAPHDGCLVRGAPSPTTYECEILKHQEIPDFSPFTSKEGRPDRRSFIKSLLGDGKTFKVRIIQEAGREDRLILSPITKGCSIEDLVQVVKHLEFTYEGLILSAPTLHLEDNPTFVPEEEPKPKPFFLFREHNGAFRCELKEDLSHRAPFKFRLTKEKEFGNGTRQQFGSFPVERKGEKVGKGTVQFFHNGTVVVRWPECRLEGIEEGNFEAADRWIHEEVQKWQNWMGKNFGYILSHPYRMTDPHAATVGHPRALKMENQIPITDWSSGRTYLIDKSTGISEDEVIGPEAGRAIQEGALDHIVKVERRMETRARIDTVESQVSRLTGGVETLTEEMKVMAKAVTTVVNFVVEREKEKAPQEELQKIPKKPEGGMYG